MTMPAKEAAKVLREFNRWRCGEIDLWDGSFKGPDPQMITAVIDAAVAALEAVDIITERARELIGLHTSEQEGLMLPTGKQFQDAVDALAQAIGARDQSPSITDSRHPRERALSEDAARGNFRAPK